jgi:hypothetical protein
LLDGKAADARLLTKRQVDRLIHPFQEFRQCSALAVWPIPVVRFHEHRGTVEHLHARYQCELDGVRLGPHGANAQVAQGLRQALASVCVGGLCAENLDDGHVQNTGMAAMDRILEGLIDEVK